MSESQDKAFLNAYRRAMRNGAYGTIRHREEAVQTLMSDSDIYRAGYKEAVTDVCKMFDYMHDRYTQALKGDTSDDELRKLELSLVTINSVVHHLDSKLRGVKE